MEDKSGIILQGLNAEQKEAVESVDGPVLIVAGAGSGKTRVLTSRVAYILDTRDVDPARILALTFTRKAAGEMKERIALMVGDRRARRVVMGTFHSVFVRFLRQYAGALGYPENFTIYDQSDSTSAVKACIRELALDDKAYKPKEILSRISCAKNALYTPADYRNNAEFMAADSATRRPRICDIFSLYQQKMKQCGVMDFDDILLQTNILLRDNAAALEEISSRFSYILVDEYQDTNYSQYLILKKLAARHRNICVVGDDSQSIYAFRGARIENILNFRKDYPECRTIRLERNYRSTSNIVQAANSVIAHNEGRIPKKCYAVGEEGEKINLMKAFSEQEEAILIAADIIRRVQAEKAQYQDFAILYRTNSQSRALEEQLRRRNLPYMIYSGNSFFDRAEIKDMMAYFKLVVNPGDDESFKRVVNLPSRGIGATSLSALEQTARSLGCSLFKAAFSPETARFGLRPQAALKIQEFCRMTDGLACRSAGTDAYSLAREIADASGLYAFYKSDTSIEGMARTANLEELLNSVEMFIEERQDEFADNEVPEDEFPVVTLADFLENTALLSNVDVSSSEDSDNKVALMTVHSAKGLEFPYVYVAGCEENLFPSGGLLASRQDIEEERRLFYVALTRAKAAVTVSFAGTRMRNGRHESNAPSRFVREIDARYVRNPLQGEDYCSTSTGQTSAFGGFGSGAFRRTPASTARSTYRYGASSPVQYVGKATGATPPVTDPDFVAVPMTQLYEGERIEHNRFGAGVIKSITGSAPDMKAVVDFDEYGIKQLMLKYAKLRPEKK